MYFDPLKLHACQFSLCWCKALATTQFSFSFLKMIYLLLLVISVNHVASDPTHQSRKWIGHHGVRSWLQISNKDSSDKLDMLFLRFAIHYEFVSQSSFCPSSFFCSASMQFRVWLWNTFWRHEQNVESTYASKQLSVLQIMVKQFHCLCLCVRWYIEPGF